MSCQAAVDWSYSAHYVRDTAGFEKSAQKRAFNTSMVSTCVSLLHRVIFFFMLI